MASIVSGVLTTLSTLTIREINFLGGVGRTLQSIKDEFEQMMDFLERADLLVEDHPDVSSWVAQVRDVAYDAEDILDEFRMHYAQRRSTRFQKMYSKLVSVKTLHVFANRIEEIKKRMREISETHGRYKTQYPSVLPQKTMSSGFSHVNNLHYDKRDDALLLEEGELVGIEVPKKELTYMLLAKDVRRNTISIVGMGGLGKTTLLKQVYDDVHLKRKFGHHVWITVSETFKLEELFKDAIRQLFKEEKQDLPQELDAMDIIKLKREVKDFLQTKKYIVVFDDVWHDTHWDAIHLAFPRNQFGSRVVVTTRNIDLAKTARTTEGGYVYHLRPLIGENAKLLFCRKAFSGAISYPPHLEQICEKILKVCEGLPLAIEVIGGVLATRSQLIEEWESFYNVEMQYNSKLNPMMKLLSLSYYDLPNHLKTCFLYLSIFPEDFIIGNDYLAQLWIAEGFVERIDGMTLEKVADKYLNELVARSLVQVAQIDQQGNIMAIRVHDIIRIIILLKAKQQNLTTIYRGQERLTSQNNVRRLAVHSSINNKLEESESHCKSIRTLVLHTYIGGEISESFLSHLLSHGRKLVKVMDLHDAQLESIPDEIFKLSHLKYLNLNNTKVKYVPKSVGKLQSLEMLSLSRTQVTELPVEIQKLRHLRHLIVGYTEPHVFIDMFEHVHGVKASCRLRNLKSLQQLYYVEAGQGNNIRIVSEIGNLLQLRVLGITKLKKEDGKELCSSLGKLRELRRLNVYAITKDELIDFEYLNSSDIPSLQRLILSGRLEKCPELISSLHGLTRIDLQYSKLRDDPLQCLHDLPNLISLYLTSAYEGESLYFKTGGFPKLDDMHLNFLPNVKYVTIDENAMPCIQHMWWRVCPSMNEIPTGIENLRHLQNLEFSNMCKEFVTKMDNLDEENAAYKGLLQISRVVISNYDDIDFRRTEARYWNKETV